MTKKTEREKKKGINQIFISHILFIFVVISVFFVTFYQVIKISTRQEVDISTTISYSEILEDYDLENITYKAVDWEGNEISGESYYGVDGTYTKERPLIKGEKQYSYWLKNDSYYVEPGRLVIDDTHRNQSIIAKAYKKEKLDNDDFRVYDKINGFYDETIFRSYDDYRDIAEFEMTYYGDERTRFPFGVVIIFEYGKQISRFDCSNMHKTYYPDYYAVENVNNDVTVFKIGPDEGEWERKGFQCSMQKYHEKILTNNKIKFTIVPFDFYLIDEDFKDEFSLGLEVEDYLMNPLNEPIFEGEITIT